MVVDDIKSQEFMTQICLKPVSIVALWISVIFLGGCNKKVISTKADKLDEPIGIYDSKIYELYTEIYGFKYDAFLLCMRKGYNNSETVDSLLDIEFYPKEWPGYAYVNKLKDIVHVAEEKIRQDSIYLSATWLQDPNYFNSGNKRVIAHCLELYASEELETARQVTDSLRRIEYNKYR